MHDPGELQAKLKTLRDTYAAQLPEKLKQLEQALSHLPHTAWDEQGFQNPLSPYRVMIVDDLVALTAYHAAVLEQAGHNQMMLADDPSASGSKDK